MDKPANQPAPANPPTTPSDVATAPPKKRPTWMIVLAALVLIVGALCILIAMQPSSFRVEYGETRDSESDEFSRILTPPPSSRGALPAR